MQDSPLFARLYDFTVWLIPLATRFPREYRQGLAVPIQHTALEISNKLQRATRGLRKIENLYAADAELAQLRHLLRLSHDLHCLSTAQYEQASEKTSEIGRLLGGWIKRESA